jgi:hypothetical protein
MTTGLEVHVEGTLARRTLHRLRWNHRLAPEQTVLRIEGSPDALQRVLEACSESGLTVERIVRLSKVDEPPTTASR